MNVYILMAQGFGDNEYEYVNIGVYSSKDRAATAELCFQEQWQEDGLDYVETRIEEYEMDVMSAEKERVFNILKDQWQFDRSRHGCLYDRGMADSYYGRPRGSHYGGVGGDSGPKIEVSDKASRDEYNAGYEYNEQMGNKKEY